MRKFLLLTAIILSIFTIVPAQEETEPAANSAITEVKLPAGTLRVLPSSVPAEINQGLDKLVEAGEGKIIQGDAEVLAWTGGGYKKASAANLIRQVQTNLQAKGWIYEVGGKEGEVTFFSALKDTPTRRAVLGYYVATDEALVLAWTEVLPANANSSVEKETRREETTVKNTLENSVKSSGTLRSLVGKWEKKQGGMSSVDANTGRYLGSSGNYESYTFHADGRVEYTMLVAVQNYGCRLEAFGQSKGRASVSGGGLNINLGAGTIKRDDSCSPSKNYTNPTKATNTDYKWTVAKDDYGVVQLCLTQPNGETFCYRRAE
ncbi:MAG TPA: hypothetical protein VK892_03900 [Pyrinomonadaceae bacterium]|nr:hypothetical protein [Pyrinomonadaceae bacterium]